MKIDLQIVSPAGNTTAFVSTPVDIDQFAIIASTILSQKNLDVEQVAFIVPPKIGAHGRIQMMGGEFCGNAARSFGYYLSCHNPEQPNQVEIEISGADQPLCVDIDHTLGTCSTAMPLPSNIVPVVWEDETYTAVLFNGIVHLMIESAPQDDNFVMGLISHLQILYPADAYGIMFLSEDTMTPVVYVVETDSLIWESSCGSGSVATSIYRSAKKSDGVYRYHLSQPGGVLETAITVASGAITECHMGGPVVIYPAISIDVAI